MPKIIQRRGTLRPRIQVRSQELFFKIERYQQCYLLVLSDWDADILRTIDIDGEPTHPDATFIPRRWQVK